MAVVVYSVGSVVYPAVGEVVYYSIDPDRYIYRERDAVPDARGSDYEFLDRDPVRDWDSEVCDWVRDRDSDLAP